MFVSVLSHATLLIDLKKNVVEALNNDHHERE